MDEEGMVGPVPVSIFLLYFVIVYVRGGGFMLAEACAHRRSKKCHVRVNGVMACLVLHNTRDKLEITLHRPLLKSTGVGMFSSQSPSLL